MKSPLVHLLKIGWVITIYQKIILSPIQLQALLSQDVGDV